MSFCSKCGTEVALDVNFCPKCGNGINAPAALATSETAAAEPAISSFDQKLHLVMAIAAGLGVYLLYTSFAFGLIGVATGVAFGLSLRLFFTHKKNEFKGTKLYDCVMSAAASTIALLLMFLEEYPIQALVMIFLFVHTLIVYLKISSNSKKA